MHSEWFEHATLPDARPAAELKLRLKPGERATAVLGGVIAIAHADHPPCYVWWEDGAMFCERIDV